MQAIRHHGPGDIRYETGIHLREAGDSVTVELLAASISPIDVDVYEGHAPGAGYPVIAGSWAIGRMAEESPAGASADTRAAQPRERERVIWFQEQLRRGRQPEPGRRVLVFPRRACLHCSACGAGLYDECENPRDAGVNVDGYLQDRFSVSPVDVVPVPEGLGSSLALFAFDVAAILRAFKLVDIREHRSLLIFGAGVQGILTAILAKRSGVMPILVDPVQPRLELARQLEIATTINPFAAHLPDDVLYASSGRLADAAIDTAGAENALAPLADAVAPGAPVVITAAGTHTQVPTRAILQNELTVYGAHPRREDYREALTVLPPLTRHLPALISSRVDLSVAPETLDLAARSPESYLKLIVTP